MKRFNLCRSTWRSQTRRTPSGLATPPLTTISTIITSMSSLRKTLCRVLSKIFHRGELPSSAKRTRAPTPLIREDLWQNRSFLSFYNIFATMLRFLIKPTRVPNNNSKMIWRLIKIMTTSRRMRYGPSKCMEVCQPKPQASPNRRRARTSLTCTNNFKTLSTCR